MFDHKHYVPILKTKAGERLAVAGLKTRTKTKITPLFEFHKHKKLDVAAHVVEICDCLASTWGTDSPLFLDTIWLHGKAGDPEIISNVFDAARDAQLQAVPVVRPDFDRESRSAVQRIIRKDGRGYLLRVTRKESKDVPSIDALLSSIGLLRRAVHLMIDYKGTAMDLAADLPAISGLNQWKTLIAASGVFPRTLTSLTQGRWHQVPRNDWTSWLNAVIDRHLPRRPSYADYTIRDPAAPADFGSPSVNLRYAKSPYWLVSIGGKVKAGRSSQMHQVCRSLMNRTEYDGPDFSDGDLAIADTAAEILGPGNATQWLQWCINHHIEFTVQDMRNHPSL